MDFDSIFEQEQKFAEPNVIHPELKSAIRYPRRADKDHVLAIGLLQFPWHEGPRRETHVTLVLSMPDEKGGVQNNMTLVVVGRGQSNRNPQVDHHPWLRNIS